MPAPLFMLLGALGLIAGRKKKKDEE
ncbi:hypothetical protein [Mammaliicoccus sciuri]